MNSTLHNQWEDVETMSFGTSRTATNSGILGGAGGVVEKSLMEENIPALPSSTRARYGLQ